MEIKKPPMVTVTVIVLVVFIVGVLLGRSISSAKSTDALNIINNNELATESFVIEQQMFAELGAGSCELNKARLAGISDELGSLGKALEQADAQESIGVDNYDILKKDIT